MTRYCHNCTFFEEVSFQQHKDHEELQISVYEFSFLMLLQKSIFCQIYNHGIP